MCDYKAVNDVVEYTGSIPMVKRWYQKILRYHFTVIHRSENMMGDVNALTRRFGENCSVYFCVENILPDKDELKRPD